MSDKIVWINKGWQPVHIGYCPNKKAWKDVQKAIPKGEKAPYPTDPGTACFFEGAGGEQSCIIVLNPEDDYTDAEISGIIVHEVVHVWQFIKEYIGEKSPSKELEAYSIQAMYQHVWDAFEKERNRG